MSTYPTTAAEQFKIPTGLSREGRKAAQTIIKVLKDRGALNSGGCTVFYSPKEWRARGEDYGTTSELIVVHDGGDHAGFFNWGYEEYKREEAMAEALAAVGVFSEACTSWYTAIYKK